jgi:uncharacterized protein YeaO (DUF488 family)
MAIQTKRVYALPASTDGDRVLVDRLWPRGLSKVVARLDLWLRDVAPSTELRRWFAHEPARWAEFRDRYRTELAEREELLDQLLDLERRHGTVTLLFAARDVARNEATVLAEALRDRASARPTPESRSGADTRF